MLYPKNAEEIQNYVDVVSYETTIIFNFTARWCRSCKKIAPDLQEFAATEAIITIDIDQFQHMDCVKAISNLPTFQIIKNGEIIHAFSGASGAVEKLQELIAT